MAERAEHLEGNHNIDTLNQMDRERGLIDWDEVFNWFDGNTTPGLKEKIAELLTGKTDGEINAQNPDAQLLLYYLYNLDNAELNSARVEFLKLDDADQQAAALAIIGDPNGEIDDTNPVHQAALVAHFGLGGGTRKFEQVFGEVYKTRFDSNKKREGPDEELPAKAEDMSELIITARNARKEEDRERASAQLRRNLGKYKRLADYYGIDFPPFLGTLYALRGNPAQLISTAGANIDSFETELVDLYRQLKGAEKAIPNLIKVPVPGNVVVYLCIRQEHALLGKMDKDFEEAAAEDFAKFSVGVTSVDFGGIKPAANDDRIFSPSKYLYDVERAAAAIAPWEWGRKSGSTILLEFPAFEGITLKLSAYDIEHKLEKLETKHLVEFIALLRMEAVQEREKSVMRGVARKDLTEVAKLVRVLEDMLAERMKKAIFEGDVKDAWKRVPGVVQKGLRDPLKRVEHDSKKVRANLKGVRLPKTDGEKHEEKSLLGKLGAIGGIIAKTLGNVVNVVKGRPITGGAGKSDAKK